MSSVHLARLRLSMCKSEIHRLSHRGLDVGDPEYDAAINDLREAHREMRYQLNRRNVKARQTKRTPI